MVSFLEYLIEGGAGGHMAHPFDIAKTGKELIQRFEEAIQYLKAGSASVKIDGINASLRLVNELFVLDRGSAKLLDIKGVRPEDLESRFGVGHGFIEKGKTIISIFDDAFYTSKKDLQKLGMIDNSNLLLNIEYVEGKTNVVEYKGITNFIAIHGMKEIKAKTVDKEGNPKSRETFEHPYDQKVMDDYIVKLNEFAADYGFQVVGKVSVKFKHEPNFNIILNKKITLNKISKTLGQWLAGVKIQFPLITKKEFVEILASSKENLSDKQINDFIIYQATIDLGDEILQSTTSDLGDMDTQEGIVIKRSDGSLYKITGSFILKGMESGFKK